MELVFWWLSVTLLVIVVAGWLIINHIQRKRPQKIIDQKLPVANSWRLAKLPEYQRLIRQQRSISVSVLIGCFLAFLLSVMLAGRPVQMSITEPETRNRDIMLCLDVSMSMADVDAALTKIYAEMVEDFDGERIGMTVFDSSSVMIFPLTNDYSYAKTQLETVSAVLSGEDMENYGSVFYGTYENDGGSSLIGDGLAGCINRFDQLGTKRSRSIIFGTDNYLAGNPIVTLLEAANFAKEKDIRVYGINPSDFSSNYYTSAEAEEYKKATLLTNGDYYKITDENTVPSIVRKITSQEATRFKGSPQIMAIDQPQVFVYLITIILSILFVISWKVRL